MTVGGMGFIPERLLIIIIIIVIIIIIASVQVYGQGRLCLLAGVQIPQGSSVLLQEGAGWG